MVIFKSLSFVHKEAIWLASRKHKDIRGNGSCILIFQDYSSEVTRARKEFAPLCSKLIKEGRKFALPYHARLQLFQGITFKASHPLQMQRDFWQNCKTRNMELLRQMTDCFRAPEFYQDTSTYFSCILFALFVI